MKKLIILLLGTLTLISCGATREISIERMNFFKDYAKTSSGHLKTIYYKSIKINPKLQEDWIKIITRMGFLIVDYDDNLPNKQLHIIDSLTNKKTYSMRQRDSIIDAVVERTRIKPWKLLSPEDKAYMIEQIKNYKTKKWTNLRPYLNITQFEEAQRISLPIISKNGEFAFIFISRPGYRGVRMYKKENGEWKFYFEGMLTIV